MFRDTRLLLALIGAVSLSVGAWADDVTRTYDEQLRVKMDQQAPGAGAASLDGGGWFSYALFKYDDEQGQRFRTLRKGELRLWGSASYDNVHSAFVRVVTGYEDWNAGDNPFGHGDDYKEFEFERAWYEFDLAEFITKQTGKKQPYGLRIRAGRQMVEMGTGLAMSMPLDAVRISAEISDFQIMGLIGRSIDDYPNIDQSQAVYSHQDRWFWGVQANYNGLQGHSIFAYYLSNYDMTRAKEPSSVNRAIQEYDYTSQYIGLGSGGQLFLPNLEYQVEMVGEMGRANSLFQGPGEGKDRICGWALDVELAYYFRDVPTRPKVWVEYLHASGDSDRRSSTTSTAGGNTQGTTDYAFNGFGFRDTGISYAPDISNLQMYQVGASFFPFENQPWGKNLEVGTQAFFYAKSAGGGPIDDTSVDNPNSRNLGWEWDAYIDWRITSDVSVTVRYGAFQPGAAYDSSEDCRQFLYAALTYSF